MLKGYEILGTDKPILKEKEEHLFSFEELTHLNESLKDYSIAAYIQISKGEQIFYKPMYTKEV